jgi:hypothetical protein
MWQAGRMAHAALGLGQTDERDPSGLKRKSALIAMAQEFLNLAGRKHVSVIVRLKEFQPANFGAIYEILTQCCDTQLDQVFGSLGEPERTEALRLLAQEITNRYQDGKREGLGPSELPVMGPIVPAHQSGMGVVLTNLPTRPMH